MGFNLEIQKGGDKFCSANEEDVDEIVELNHQFHLDMKDFEWDKSEWVEEEIMKGNYYVYKTGDQILGAINLQKISDDEVYIEAIAVDSDSHGRGIGKRLIDFAKQIAREMKVKQMTVESFESYGLFDFYIKVGFRLDDPPTGFHEGKPFHRFVMNLE